MKAKKLLLGLLSLICFGFSAFVITSCGEHVHEWNSGEITQEATCTLDGIKTYKCESCDETKTEIIYSKGHVEVIDAAVEPTCTKTGLTEGKHCSKCNQILVYQQTLLATGHTEVTDEAVEPTCTETGLTEGKHCLTCNEVLVAQEVVDALEHTEVIDAAVEPTCTETGLTEGKHCDICKEVLVKQKEVEMKAHEWNYICSKCGQINKEYYTKGLEFKLDSARNCYSVSVGTASDTEIIIPSFYNGLPVTSIRESAFLRCSSLISITIPDSVTSIGARAFYGCRSLTSVTIPDSVTSIGDASFYECSTLTSVTIGNSVTSIGDHAFYGCTSLTSIEIPDSVTNIGWYAFRNCVSLTSITIPDSVTSIGNSAFYDCGSLTSITIPDSVTSIGDSAFQGCSSLTSITIPDSVTIIDDWAFSGCSSLTSITIPNSVTSIGDYTFYECSSLESIIISDSVSSIGSFAFADCSSLTNITIPSSITSIEADTFYNCDSLTSITIPDSVTSIGDFAFKDCISLSNIYYTGTEEQWNNINIGSYNDYLKYANIYFVEVNHTSDIFDKEDYFDNNGRLLFDVLSAENGTLYAEIDSMKAIQANKMPIVSWFTQTLNIWNDPTKMVKSVYDKTKVTLPHYVDGSNNHYNTTMAFTFDTEQMSSVSSVISFEIISDAEGNVLYFAPIKYTQGSWPNLATGEGYWSSIKDYKENPVFVFADDYDPETNPHAYQKVMPEGGSWIIGFNNRGTPTYIDRLWNGIIGLKDTLINNYSSYFNITMEDEALETALMNAKVKGTLDGRYLSAIVYKVADTYQRYAYYSVAAEQSGDANKIAYKDIIKEAIIIQQHPAVKADSVLFSYYEKYINQKLNEWAKLLGL